MKPKYDKQADAVYVEFDDVHKPFHHGVDLDEQRRIDYSSDGSPIGVELLGVSHGVNLNGIPRKDEIGLLINQQSIRVYTLSIELIQPDVQNFLLEIEFRHAPINRPNVSDTEAPSEEVTEWRSTSPSYAITLK